MPQARYNELGDLLASGGGGTIVDIDTTSTQWTSVLDVEGKTELARLVSIYLTRGEAAGADAWEAGHDASLVARVTWGAAGAYTQAEIDVRRGARIAVCASTVRVDMRVDPVLVPQVQGFRAGAFLAGGVSGSPVAPTRTLQIGVLASGASSAAQQTPRYSSTLRVYRTPQLAVSVIMRDATGAVIAIESYALGAEVGPIILPHDCAQIVLRNDSGTTPLDAARLVFALEL